MNQTRSCAVGQFRVEFLPRPHFIERFHRCPTHQINLVETKKFCAFHIIQKGIKKRDRNQEGSYRNYKNKSEYVASRDCCSDLAACFQAYITPTNHEPYDNDNIIKIRRCTCNCE